MLKDKNCVHRIELKFYTTISMPTLQYGSNFQMLKKREVCVLLAAEMNNKGEYTD